jgi:hypothetical protein
MLKGHKAANFVMAKVGCGGCWTGLLRCVFTGQPAAYTFEKIEKVSISLWHGRLAGVHRAYRAVSITTIGPYRPFWVDSWPIIINHNVPKCWS